MDSFPQIARCCRHQDEELMDPVLYGNWRGRLNLDMALSKLSWQGPNLIVETAPTNDDDHGRVIHLALSLKVG